MTTPETPHYGHEPIIMRRVLNENEIVQAGDFVWKTTDKGRYLIVTVPRIYENSSIKWLFQCLPVKQGPNEVDKHWGWDGNEDRPTLTPSVHAVGYWHGWVRNGTLVEA